VCDRLKQQLEDVKEAIVIAERCLEDLKRQRDTKLPSALEKAVMERKQIEREQHSAVDATKELLLQLDRLKGQIRLADLEASNDAENSRAFLAEQLTSVAKWDQDAPRNLHPFVLEFFRTKRGLFTSENQLTLHFLENVPSKDDLVALWAMMNKEGFGFNPACPDDLKDARAGYENHLKGIRKKSPTLVIATIVRALALDDDEEE